MRNARPAATSRNRRCPTAPPSASPSSSMRAPSARTAASSAVRARHPGCQFAMRSHASGEARRTRSASSPQSSARANSTAGDSGCARTSAHTRASAWRSRAPRPTALTTTHAATRARAPGRTGANASPTKSAPSTCATTVSPPGAMSFHAASIFRHAATVMRLLRARRRAHHHARVARRGTVLSPSSRRWPPAPHRAERRQSTPVACRPSPALAPSPRSSAASRRRSHEPSRR